jgi:osmoprotectant transport system ATP-binding protein
MKRMAAAAEPLIVPGGAGRGAASGAAQRAMISFRHVSKSYGPHAPVVEDLTLDVYQGEILALTGPSGCGKTTTLKMVNRLVEPTRGEISVDGTEVHRLRPHELRQRIGYVIQNVGLFPHLTIEKNVATVPRLLGWDKRRIEQRVDEVLRLVGLDPDVYRRRFPRELSGGQAQRVGVARALAGDPPVLLMDEPFAAVDPITRASLQDEFLALQRRLEKTIVLVTHDMAEAMKMADRVAILGPAARIVQLGSPTEVLSHPADEFVAQMLGTGRTMQLLASLHLRDLPLEHLRLCPGEEEIEVGDAAHRRLLVLDGRRPAAWRERTATGSRNGTGPQRPVTCVVNHATSTLRDALERVLQCPYACAVVVDSAGDVLGVVDFGHLWGALAARRDAIGLGGDGR